MKFFAILLCASLIGLGIVDAADRVVSTKKAEKGAITTPAAVTPQGGLSFGESSAPTPAQLHRAKRRWPEMTQQEIDGLTVLLKNMADPVPVMIVCKDALCEDLALNLDNAFESARWKSDVMLGTSFGVPEGVRGSSRWLVDLFNAATGGRYGAKIDEPKSADGEYLLIGPKPR